MSGFLPNRKIFRVVGFLSEDGPGERKQPHVQDQVDYHAEAGHHPSNAPERNRMAEGIDASLVIRSR
jgi:hypothetical protein